MNFQVFIAGLTAFFSAFIGLDFLGIKDPTDTGETLEKQVVAQQNQPASSVETDGQDADILPIEKEVLALVNQEREKHGLKPLQLDAEVFKVANMKSQDMRDHHYFDHQSPTYGSPFEMLKQQGIDFKAAGENIAAGQKTAEEVMDGWMNSEGHRANILNPNFTHIGIGYVQGGDHGTYWTQLFIQK